MEDDTKVLIYASINYLNSSFILAPGGVAWTKAPKGLQTLGLRRFIGCIF